MGWSTSSSPARRSRSWRPCAARSTCRSRRTSRSGARRIPTWSATSRPPTSPCSRCSRSAGCAPACGSRRRSGCRSSCRRRWRPRSGSRPASRWPRALPSLPYACGLATVQLLTADVAGEPLLPVDGVLPVGLPTVDPHALDMLSATPRPGGALGGPAGGGACPVTRHGGRARRSSRPLVESGVREVVLAPGSRNAPLSFAAYDAAEAGLLRLHTRIDERTAGFLALGLTKGGSRAAVMCTSGTAVANLHPAVLEAHHAGVALVVVTADRPDRLRGTDANQTTDQVGIFGPQVSTRRRGRCRSTRSGRSSCTSTCSSTTRWCRPTAGSRTSRPVVEEGALRPSRNPGSALGLGPRTVVVAGDDAGPRARALAAEAGWPLLAEPSSGARTGPALRTYRLLLATELADAGRAGRRLRPPHAVPAGAAAAGPRRRRGARCATRRGRGPTPSRRSSDPVVDGADDPAWLAAWQEADASVSRQLDALLDAGRLHGVPRRRRGQPRAAARRPPRRRRLEPDPRPRPDGHGVRRRQPPQGDRQPRPLRHRRHRLDRDRRLAGPARRGAATSR